MWKSGQEISELPVQNQVIVSLGAQLRAFKACGHHYTGLTKITKR
jgi:hypothetical protein